MKTNNIMALFFGLALTTIYSPIIPAERTEEPQREGESPEAYAKRIGAAQAEGKKRAIEIKNEPLSWVEDYPSIKWYGGYKKFYDSPKSHFLGLSKEKMKTFFEEWLQEGITNNNIQTIREAYDAAISFKIPLNELLLKHAALTVQNLLHNGMTFLTRTLPPKEVHKVGDDLQKLAHSVR